ncbi:pyridoxal phosphate-dependent aminotransferase family protein [Chlamydia sp. 17-3921]|uniref:aminotransferase class I/II-fold pyridoxal phosphate-dependent enzyme n=1 Tax=Chlamydia sp. 17-3921 TaxID=2675798 RepID=UPI0019190A17|nr:pyridoxal phosphate-dependent aminotransferase family protein [Chlamydia sp. 17-3921]
MSSYRFLEEALEQSKAKNTYRQLSTFPHLIDFTSNDYLGFAQSLELHSEIFDRIKSVKTLGATGSRLLTGHSKQYEDLEILIAKYHKAENALIFNTGYTANLGLISTIATVQDRILHDFHIHASIHDGIRLSKAKSFPFRHNDLYHLEQRLATPWAGRTFVCVESVYSLIGSIAPLQKIQELCEHYEAFLIVDEAHAIGIFGNYGEGLTTHLGLQNKVFATLYTFGKALGVHGAAITCSTILKNYLINFCRPFIYTTALPSSALIAIKAAYKHNEISSSLRKYLTNLISFFRKQAIKLDVPLQKVNENSQIQSICIPGTSRVRDVALQLRSFNFDVRPILSPTVKQKQELLRICLHTFNTKEEISQLLSIISKALTLCV